jgi:hypothetical protein
MKLASTVLIAILVSIFPAPAEAAGKVTYKNQKAGQFCKAADVGKFTISPAAGKLKCIIKKGTNRARWSN